MGIDQIRTVGLRLFACDDQGVCHSISLPWELTRSGRWDCDERAHADEDVQHKNEQVGIDQIRTVGLRRLGQGRWIGTSAKVGIDQIRTVGLRLGELEVSVDLTPVLRIPWELTRSGRWDCDLSEPGRQAGRCHSVGIDQIRTVGLRLLGIHGVEVVIDPRSGGN